MEMAEHEDSKNSARPARDAVVTRQITWSGKVGPGRSYSIDKDQGDHSILQTAQVRFNRDSQADWNPFRSFKRF